LKYLPSISTPLQKPACRHLKVTRVLSIVLGAKVPKIEVPEIAAERTDGKIIGENHDHFECKAGHDPIGESSLGANSQLVKK